MILLIEQPAALQLQQVILVFGSGLIGTAIVDELCARSNFTRKRMDLSWTNPILQQQQLRRVEDSVARLCGRGGCGSVDVVWSAGRAGFNAVSSQTEPELASFEAVLTMACRIATEYPRLSLGFSLTSSAGGLFEGQKSVGPGAIPAPRRPYGTLKLQQEELLSASSVPIVKRIFRLTSVYGYVRGDQRRGLIGTLLLNGLRQQVSAINGHMSTLRDFTWIEDIARCIVHEFMSRNSQDATHLLASGMPSSIYEIQKMIEATIGRAIFVSYLHDPDNWQDTTFAPSAAPVSWTPSHLRTNIRKIYYETIASGVAFQRTARTSHSSP
jgi:UDP-glucose 4-epimerase